MQISKVSAKSRLKHRGEIAVARDPSFAGRRLAGATTASAFGWRS